MIKLQKLGYTKKWLELGLLTNQELELQIEEFDKSEDKNTEHYRYKTFKKYLTNKKVLTDRELDNFLNLSNSEKALSMSIAAKLDLFRDIELTDIQFNKVCKEIFELGASVQKIVIRQRLLRRLKKENLTEQLFEEIVTSNDSVTQSYILNLSNKSQLKELIENGATKEIKKKATEKLNKLTIKNDC